MAELISEQDKYLFKEAPKWSLLIAIANIIFTNFYYLVAIQKDPTTLISMRGVLLLNLVLLTLVGIIVHFGLKTIAKKNVPMNKYLMAFSIVIFASLIISIINYVIYKEFHIGLGLIPMIISLIVAKMTNVKSEPIR